MQAIIYQRRTGHDTRLWFRAHHGQSAYGVVHASLSRI